jgi:hypothetical protein
MARKRYTAEETIGQLRTVEIKLAKGLAVVEACRKRGITEQVYGRITKRGTLLYATRGTGDCGRLAATL